MRKTVMILVLCVACLWADVPNEITYQGRLREYGQPVNGSRTMRFSIYDAVTNGTQRWTSGDVNVTVSSGVFTYALAPSSIDWRVKDYWIEIIISGKVLSPREKITAQVFALHSQTAESLTRSSGDIKFEIGATSYVVVNSGGLRLNSGTITFVR